MCDDLVLGIIVWSIRITLIRKSFYSGKMRDFARSFGGDLGMIEKIN